LSFDVKPPAGDIKRTTIATLPPKGGKLVISADLLADLIPSTARVTTHVGPLANLNVPGLLAELDRYPYGCAEQTTSRAMPLLYVNDVARQIGIGADATLKARVAAAIDRVFEMQDSSGAFGVWGPSNGDLWLTSYVTDFLLRAKEIGHVVNAKALSLALDKLANSVAIEQDFTKGGENRAYALYVLARGGRAPVGELRYDIDARLDKFATPLAQAQLGAALGLVGDRERAEKAFAAALKRMDTAVPDVDYRRDYGSGLRDGAAMLTLASEFKLAKLETPRLVDVLAKAYAAKQYTSTQEQAWMLLAAKSIADQAGDTTFSVNGAPHQGKLIRSITSTDLQAGAVTIENTSDTATSAVVSVIGSALTPEPATSKGFTIERQFYTMDGAKVDLKSAVGGVSTIAQNDRFVVVLKIDAADVGGRIMLVDRLPAGFEIENPRIVDSGDIKTLDWLKTTRTPEHTEFRDDRFVAAFDFFGAERRNRQADGDALEATKTATVAYIVRAVTPGKFTHPAATVEDMYRPERHARTAAGQLTVTAK
jgi:alpha-2-macroglobulin